jgi:hypothetical protein
MLAETPDGIPFKDLPKLVREHLGVEEAEQIGSISWYTTTIKLEMEVRGEICRSEQPGHQVLTAA